MDYPWYEIVNGNKIQQGDILKSFPVFLPDINAEIISAILAGDEAEAPVRTQLINAIIVTQSCDLTNAKVDSVIVCPVWQLDDIKKKITGNEKEKKKQLEDIRQGKQHSLHMLASSTEPPADLSVVEFKRLYTTPKDVIVSFAASSGDRLRLLPPYREHLSQAFARFFYEGRPTYRHPAIQVEMHY